MGANNEGKSNVLKALVSGLQLLSGKGRYLSQTRSGRRMTRYSRDAFYADIGFDWSRDYPIDLQEKEPDGTTDLVFEFSLEGNDITSFQKDVGVRLATNLKAKLQLGAEKVAFEPLMPGRAKKTLATKRKEIGKFIEERVYPAYIPAVRSAENVRELVQDLLRQHLWRLEKSEKYQEAVRQLADLRRPVEKQLAELLGTTMKEFLPSINSVAIETEKDFIQRAYRSSCQVMLDDGNMTNLDQKGDGVVSLSAISIVRHTSQRDLGDRNLIMVIEEPESHLHPNGIHFLKRVLKQISGTHQVVLSTHNPIMVERKKTGGNIVVSRRRAKKADSIDEVRESLGIRVEDNLIGSTIVLLVEGEEDVRLVTHWLRYTGLEIRSAIDNGIVAITKTGGASKLPAYSSLYKSWICDVLALLDDDIEGRRAEAVVTDGGHLEDRNIFKTIVRNRNESELEDLVSTSAYKHELGQKFGVNFNTRTFRDRRKKWTARVSACFVESGKTWNDTIEKKVKTWMADHLSQANNEVLIKQGETTVSSLARVILDRLAE